MTDIDSASQDSPETLRHDTEAAHAAYSAAYHQREDAEAALASTAGRRAMLIKEIRKLQRSTETRMLALISSAVENPAKCDAREVVESRARIEILEITLKHFSVFAFADAEHAVLESRVNELLLQLNLERLRQSHHDQTIVLALSGLQSSAGELQTIGLGERSEAMGRVVHQVAAALAETREQLRRQDSSTHEAREQFKKETSWKIPEA